MKKLMLGNAAIARGAYEAGVRVVSAYPGTPSTEVSECIAGYDEVYAEWAPNEKVAFEVAVGASIAGARSMVCMKHVGVNVAADPMFTAAYTGVNGGLVILAADDPGMHSSQNEQDTRFYARSAHIPMLEPADSAEAKEFTKLAFELSENYDTPVFVRTTTRLAHSQSFVEEGERVEVPLRPYVKDVAKYTMMPSSAIGRHVVVEARENRLARDVNDFEINREEMRDAALGIVCSGVVYQYVREAVPEASVLKLGMVYPLAIEKVRDFAKKVKRLVVVEELEPFFENQLKATVSPARANRSSQDKASSPSRSYARSCSVSGRRPRSRICPCVLPSCARVARTAGCSMCSASSSSPCPRTSGATPSAHSLLSAPSTPWCAWAQASASLTASRRRAAESSQKDCCRHRRQHFHPQRHNRAHRRGLQQEQHHAHHSGQLHHGYDGSSTAPRDGLHAQTGARQNPGHRRALQDGGLRQRESGGQLRLAELEKAVREETAADGVSVIVAKRPCALLNRNYPPACRIEDCRKCGMCFRLGCPAIEKQEDGSAKINASLCVGCGLCSKVCRFGAIKEG